MSLAMAKCPYCNENIEVNINEPASICSYCGHPFITEHALNNYTKFYNKKSTAVIDRDLDANFVIDDGVLIKYKGEKLDVVIPKGIYKIKGGCFARQNIRSVRLNDDIVELASENAALGAFSGCTSLKSINLPESLMIIGDSTFSGCTNLEITSLPENLEYIGSHAFEGCQQLTSVKVPDTVKKLKPYTFARCYNLKKVILPDHFTHAESYLFFSCLKLNEINMEIFDTIGDNAFNGCISINQLHLHEGLVEIGDYAFKGCIGLNSLVLPESLKVLGAGAFDSCKNISSIRFPEALDIIGDGAFRECESLNEVIYTRDNVKLGEDIFEECLLLKDKWSKELLCPMCGGEREAEFLSYTCKRCGRKSLTKRG